MNNSINVAVTGYIGTGSSAVIDFLREFDVCAVALGKDKAYEHIPFYVDHGLFDLGAILMNVNSALRSDTAICSFLESMKRLNDNNFGWFGSYKWYVGERFEKAVNEFIEKISISFPGRSCNHYIKVKFSLFKVLLQIAAKIIYKRPVYKWGRVYVYDNKQMYFSMPTYEEYYSAARKFVNDYFDICAEPNKQVMVYDHLLWPQHTRLVDDYFGDNFRLIVVLRDPRDVYILDKHYWHKPPVGNGDPFFPTKVQDFVDYWKRIRGYEAKVSRNKILYVQFEDLIYNYEQTAKQIMDFVGLKKEEHVAKRRYFNPDKSIKNTQTFTLEDEWLKEADFIQQKLPESTYDFPYEISTSFSEMFDDPNYVTTSFKKKNIAQTK